MENPFYFIKDKLEDVYYSFKHGIPNLINWFPVIWKNREYDESYIFRLLEKKFELMEKTFSECDYIHNPKEVEELKLAKLLCKRLGMNNFDYEENAFISHDKKWGEFDINLEVELFVRTRENVITVEDEEKERNEFLRWYKHSENQIKQDKEMLGKLISKKSRKWWL